MNSTYTKGCLDQVVSSEAHTSVDVSNFVYISHWALPLLNITNSNIERKALNSVTKDVD